MAKTNKPPKDGRGKGKGMGGGRSGRNTGKSMTLKDIYAEIKRRTTRGNSKFYHPLDEHDSKVIREDYTKRTLIPLEGDDREFFTKSGTLIARGYTRVVVGDYGAYVEFGSEQINRSAIRDRFSRNNPRPYQKYWWMESFDIDRIKIYEQIRTVKYADYKPGLFYISPEDLYNNKGGRLYNV